MIFNTWTFAAFALVTWTLYWTIVPQRLRPHFLIAAGLVFYTFAIPAYLILIVALAAITFGAARLMLAQRTGPAKKAVLVTAVAALGGTLVYFKYSRFLIGVVDQIAARHVLPLPSLVVPLAISFFTFEFVHVLVDVALGKIRQLRLLDFAAFTLFFPTLVAGPIKRYQSFAPQLRRIEPPDRGEVLRHAYRVAIGLFKKIVVADTCSVLAAPLVSPGVPFARLDYCVGFFAYAAKIYFDFSGYSDIAIGIAGLLGLRIPENFDRPYRSRNIAEFWRRWHISLSAWIRDYVFIPLGGSRRPPIVVLANLLLAMALAGLWHGAAWTFLIWGLWHGAGLGTHRLWSALVVPRVPFLARSGSLVATISVALTFTFVGLGWVVFAATSLGNARAVLYDLLFG